MPIIKNNKQAERARKAAQPRVARRPSPGKNATVSGGAESVEQFMARGGSVERLPGIKSSPVYLPRRPVLALRGAKSP